MARKHRITAEENALIRAAAKKVAKDRCILQAKIRVDTNDNRSVNVDLMNGEHDLFDFMPWADLRKGFEMTASGGAQLDICVYYIDPVTKSREEPAGHVYPIWKNNELVSIGDEFGTLWAKEA